MKKIAALSVLVVLFLGVNFVNAQTTLVVTDSVTTKSSSEASRTYKVFYDKAPIKGDSKKQPVYREFKVIGGIIYAASGTTNFSDIKKPFALGQNLLPNVCFITGKTYHNIVYGLANNTVKIVNGYPFGEKGLDIYIVPGVNLNSGVTCLATGIEKKVTAGDVNFFMFAEVNKDFKSESKLTLSIGFHVNIQGVIHQRKGKEIFIQQ